MRKYTTLLKSGLGIFSVSLYTDSIFLLANTITTSLIGFAFWILATRLYTPADVGIGTVIVSATGFLSLLATAGLTFTLIRFLPQSQNPASLTNTCLATVSILGLAIAGIYLVGLHIWTPALIPFMQNKVFPLAVVGLTSFAAMSGILGSAFIATGKAKYILIKNTLFQVLKVALMISLVVSLTSLGIPVAWCLALLATVVVCLFILLPRSLSAYRVTSPLALKQLISTRSYSGASYLAWLLELSPRLLLPILVINILGAEQSAYFYIAWMVANLLFTIPSSISCILFKEGSWEEGTLRRNTTKSLKFSFLLLLLAITAMFLLGRWALLIFGSIYSANALHLLWVLALPSLPMTFVYMLTAIYRVTKQLRKIVGIWAAVAVGTLVLSYLLMPTIGIMSIGYVWLGIQSIVGGYCARVLFKQLT